MSAQLLLMFTIIYLPGPCSLNKSHPPHMKVWPRLYLLLINITHVSSLATFTALHFLCICMDCNTNPRRMFRLRHQSSSLLKVKTNQAMIISTGISNISNKNYLQRYQHRHKTVLGLWLPISMLVCSMLVDSLVTTDGMAFILSHDKYPVYGASLVYLFYQYNKIIFMFRLGLVNFFVTENTVFEMLN